MSSFEGLNLAQSVSLTIVATVTGTFSALASAAIMWMILKSKEYNTVKYRMLFGICFSDFINSFVYIFWSLPLPKDTPGVWGAIGNKETCDFQGFLFTCHLIGSFYNGALGAYYWLSVCYNMSDEEISKRYEKWTHIVSIVFPVSTAIAALAQDLYSISPMGCWIAPTPSFCQIRPGIECVRGRHAYAYAWIYTGIPLILIDFFVSFTMYRIYVYVLAVTQAVSRYDFARSVGSVAADSSNTNVLRQSSNSRMDLMRFSGSQEKPRSENTEPSQVSNASAPPATPQVSLRQSERLRETAFQAFLYLVAYMSRYTISLTANNVEFFGYRNPFVILLLLNLFFPLQGVFNIMVFLRPRIRDVRKWTLDAMAHDPNYKEPPLWKIWWEATFNYANYQRVSTRFPSGQRGSSRRFRSSENSVSRIVSARGSHADENSDSKLVSVTFSEPKGTEETSDSRITASGPLQGEDDKAVKESVEDA